MLGIFTIFNLTKSVPVSKTYPTFVFLWIVLAVFYVFALLFLVKYMQVCTQKGSKMMWFSRISTYCFWNHFSLQSQFVSKPEVWPPIWQFKFQFNICEAGWNGSVLLWISFTATQLPTDQRKMKFCCQQSISEYI